MFVAGTEDPATQQPSTASPVYLYRNLLLLSLHVLIPLPFYGSRRFFFCEICDIYVLCLHTKFHVFNGRIAVVVVILRVVVLVRDI